MSADVNSLEGNAGAGFDPQHGFLLKVFLVPFHDLSNRLLPPLGAVVGQLKQMGRLVLDSAVRHSPLA